MATKKYNTIRVVRIKKGDDLKTIYAKVKRSFTAADLQRFTEDEEMFPIEPLLQELKAIHREELRKMKKKATSFTRLEMDVPAQPRKCEKN